MRADVAPVLVKSEALSQVYPVRGLDRFRRYVEVLRPYHSAAPEVMTPVLVPGGY